LAGENNEIDNWFEFPTSIARAIVSPSARPNPSTIAPNSPRAAVGRITLRIVSQRVAPRPSAASFNRCGTALSASRDSAETVGRIMIASTNDAGSIPGPLKEVPKIGIQPK